MSEIADEVQKIIDLNGDTYSSYEVLGALRKLNAENEWLRQALNATDEYLRDHDVSFYSNIRQQIHRALGNKRLPHANR